jgi:hypothetical protein
MVQRDYILRMIEQFAQAIAAIVAHLTGGRLEEAKRDIDATYRSLGVSRSMVLPLDNASLVLLVGAEKADLVIKLFAVEAELLRKEGRTKDAEQLDARVMRWQKPTT